MILQLKGRVPIYFSCKYFGVCRSRYYKWVKGEHPISFYKKEDICNQIKEEFKLSKNTYGAPRIYQVLKGKGINVSENTVAKYMRELRLDGRHRKAFKVQTTDSDHEDPIATRVFKTKDKGTLPSRPDEILAGDITYLRLGANKFLYLAVVIDLFNREVVGWSMSNNMETLFSFNSFRKCDEKSWA